jgi:hypothetical protein
VLGRFDAVQLPGTATREYSEYLWYKNYHSATYYQVLVVRSSPLFFQEHGTARRTNTVVEPQHTDSLYFRKSGCSTQSTSILVPDMAISFKRQRTTTGCQRTSSSVCVLCVVTKLLEQSTQQQQQQQGAKEVFETDHDK